MEDMPFLIFDKERAAKALGENPRYEFMFEVLDSVHEAPVYVPESNLLYLSELPPMEMGDPSDWLEQYVIDLNQDPPTLNRWSPQPPVFSPNGGAYLGGKLIWTCSGGFDDINGTEQRIALHSIDPKTNESHVILNNYFGFYFNNMNDVTVHPTTGDIFFTDPQYPWLNSRVDTAPQLPTATYRFNMKTGAVTVVDMTIAQPNGLGFSPDGGTLYIAESAALSGSVSPEYPGTKSYNTTGPRGIFAFDVDNNGTKIHNKRSFYLVQDYIPDGLDVSADGLVLSASGHGLDVLADTGELVMRIQTNHSVANFAFTGENLDQLWLVGNKGISKVDWNVKGQPLI